jgi:diadenylate cyclase
VGGDLRYLVATFTVRDAIDVLLVAVVVAWFLRIIRDSRAFQMARGLGLVVVAALLARHFNLAATSWVLGSFIILWAVALIVVFQPELRRMVSTMGEQKFLTGFFPRPKFEYGEIAEACRIMAQQGWGGIIVVERRTNLTGFAESGTMIDAAVKSDLLATIFTPGSPLHDGAVILREGRVYAAGCTLPLSETRTQVATFGMRHRAAIGITEETDALAIVVSEEQRTMAMAKNGQMTPPLDLDTLASMLSLHASGKEAP